ncbi:MAG TPA: hypothetical protein VFR81_04415 [Longimicrobium sp.]|nr:hypothetical protein [Longimicrobium sp.]
MKKLRLDIDHLAVESFDTVNVRGAAPGTVRGYNSDPWWQCGGNHTIWPQCQPTDACQSGGCLQTAGCHTAYCVVSYDLPCTGPTCDGAATCGCPTRSNDTCNGSCAATCAGTCDTCQEGCYH